MKTAQTCARALTCTNILNTNSYKGSISMKSFFFVCLFFIFHCDHRNQTNRNYLEGLIPNAKVKY